MSQKAIDIASRAYQAIMLDIAEQQVVVDNDALLSEVMGHLNALVTFHINGNPAMHGNEMGAVMAEQINGAGK